MKRQSWSAQRVHPSLRWERWLYLLRHWRCPAARQRLKQQAGATLARLTRRAPVLAAADGCLLSPALDYARRQGSPVRVVTAAMDTWSCAPREWLVFAPGADVVAALFDWRAQLSRPDAPTILFSSHQPRHPVESLWLLEWAGYAIYQLQDGALSPCIAGWHTPLETDRPGAWLVALPGRNKPAETPNERIA